MVKYFLFDNKSGDKNQHEASQNRQVVGPLTHVATYIISRWPYKHRQSGGGTCHLFRYRPLNVRTSVWVDHRIHLKANLKPELQHGVSSFWASWHRVPLTYWLLLCCCGQLRTKSACVFCVWPEFICIDHICSNSRDIWHLKTFTASIVYCTRRVFRHFEMRVNMQEWLKVQELCI